MKTLLDDDNNEKGFIYVASNRKKYYHMAKNSAESLRDFYEDANITLFSHEEWIEDEAYELFDKIIVEIPVHQRAKMWCMARTPYEKTVYCDVDSFILNSDIENIFDELKDNDLCFIHNFDYTVGNSNINNINGDKKLLHGAVCLYNNEEKTKAFHQKWFDEYLKQVEIKDSEWKWENIHSDWKRFDMLTLWRLYNNFEDIYPEVNELKFDILPRRWNTTILDIHHHIKGSPVIMQMPKENFAELEFYKSFKKEGETRAKHKFTKQHTEKTVIKYC